MANYLFLSESIWEQGVVYDPHFISEGLSGKGHQVFAFSASLSSADPDVEYTQEFKSLNGRPVNLINPAAFLTAKPWHPRDDQARTYFWKLKRFIFALLVLRAFLKRQQIDAIILYSVARIGVAAVLVAKLRGIPIYFRNIDILPGLWPSKLDQIIVSLAEYFIYPNMKKIFAYTIVYKSYIAKRVLKPEKIEVVPQAIDFNFFYPFKTDPLFRKKWGIPDDAKVVLFMGHFYKFGGLEDFFAYAQDILQAEPKTKILLVGDGVTRTEIWNSVQRNGLEDSVIFTGLQPYEDMPQFINLADVCINVFKVDHKSTRIFSAKIPQYLSCKKPVVATRMLGVETMLPTASSGVIYTDTIGDMPRHIIELLSDGALSEELAEKGYNFVVRNFSVARAVASVESATLDKKMQHD